MCIGCSALIKVLGCWWGFFTLLFKISHIHSSLDLAIIFTNSPWCFINWPNNFFYQCWVIRCPQPSGGWCWGELCWAWLSPLCSLPVRDFQYFLAQGNIYLKIFKNNLCGAIPALAVRLCGLCLELLPHHCSSQPKHAHFICFWACLKHGNIFSEEDWTEGELLFELGLLTL